MHVGFRNIGQVVIHDERDLIDVEPAGGDVRRDQHGRPLGLEFR
jgi:hypothetical protein